MSIKETLEKKILHSVEKPARYIGNEYGAAEPKEKASIRFALAFPDLYEVGMSHLGFKILYHVLNSMEDVACERVFAPALDMAAKMNEHSVPLYSLESFSPITEFSFFGFSLQYELSITNVLYMLELSGVPAFSKDRAESCPIIVAGGPCCVNPEPIREFFDVIFIGESEESLPLFIETYKSCIASGEGRQAFLQKAAGIEGVFVPLYSQSAKRAYIKDFAKAPFPALSPISNIEAIFDRAMLEIMRGCARGCRFCQAGYIYRPLRMKPLETLLDQGREMLAQSGYNEISLCGLSSTDYPYCGSLIQAFTEEGRVKASLPSLRIDTPDLKLIEKSVSSLTFAPEAGSQRMRDAINKNLSEEQILSVAQQAYEMGCKRLKLYFMVGLPGESDEDAYAIADLANLILANSQKPKLPHSLALSVSVSCFVPKPHTPFMFNGQLSREALSERIAAIARRLYKKIKLSYSDPASSVVEAALSRGGSEACAAIYEAYKAGAVFSSWSEHFDYSQWEAAFLKAGLNLEEYAQRSFSYESELPWGYIDIGIDKEFFVSEAIKAREGICTPSCFESCSACGISREGKCSFEV
ncbi:MAG: radical SAM protein [Eubacteriaceae bacterium]|nr:radical SAM protein [Eubacteriaceae bacterium]